MPNFVRAIVSKKKLILKPDISPDSSEGDVNGENEFDVTVINESNKFASFQLEISPLAADADSNLKWYRVEPEICAKKPPGDRTTFHVVITKAPIPVSDTTIDLTLRVFSVEFEKLFTTQKLSLTIERPRKPIQIYLPIKDLKGYPGDAIEIPALVYNLSSKVTEVTLRLLGLDTSWLSQGSERKLPVDPGESEKTTFWCQLPSNPKPLNQKYDFTIEATADTASRSFREPGILEVLPQGTVHFFCTSKQQTLPSKHGLSSRKPSHSTTYELNFENDSNLAQQVNIQISEQDQKQCGLILPDSVNLNPGETKPMYLVAKKQRHWLGLEQRLPFEVSPVLMNSSFGEPNSQIRPNPSHQSLELQILPIIPFLLQLGGGLLALLLLWLLWLNRPIGHKSNVNFVRFSGDGTTILSGSSDQSILRWPVNSSTWQFDALSDWSLKVSRLNSPENIGERIGKAVRVVRHGERNNLVAVGLEDGTIELWDVSFRNYRKPLNLGTTDRVFDLAFTKDSRYLFSGHGSGNVQVWDVQEQKKFKSRGTQIKLGTPPIAELIPRDGRVRFFFSVSALALSESQSKPTLVVVAGQFNKLVLWDWEHNKLYEIPYQWQESEKPYKFNPIIGKHHYIKSLATADNLLATADTQGYITLWDMDKMRQCISTNSSINGADNNVNNTAQTGSNNALGKVDCDAAILKQWRERDDGKPVRSVALSQDGCYLASAGDNGQVMLWPLTTEGKPLLKEEKVEGKALAQFPVRLNSVDINVKDEQIRVTSDADKNVMLYLINKRDIHANCK